MTLVIKTTRKMGIDIPSICERNCQYSESLGIWECEEKNWSKSRTQQNLATLWIPSCDGWWWGCGCHMPHTIPLNQTTKYKEKFYWLFWQGDTLKDLCMIHNYYLLYFLVVVGCVVFVQVHTFFSGWSWWDPKTNGNRG